MYNLCDGHLFSAFQEITHLFHQITYWDSIVYSYFLMHLYAPKIVYPQLGNKKSKQNYLCD